MKAFIETIANCLERMIRVRQSYFDNEDELLRKCNDYKIHNRLFAIYSKDTPETLVHILYKLKLTEEDDSYGQHNVSSVLKNFWNPAKAAIINRAVNFYYKKENVEVLVEKVEHLADEMEKCFNYMQVAA
jgi:hypothetical protein